MGDTHPLTNNEHFSYMDVAQDLNSDDPGPAPTHRKDSGILSPYNVNGRLVVIVIAVSVFLLSFLLFVGTIVFHFSSSSGSGCVSQPLGTGQEGAKGTASAKSVTILNGVHAPPGALVYSQEFDGFDLESWDHFSAAMQDSEARFFHYIDSRNNSFVRDGKLFLKATYTADVFGMDHLYNGSLLLGSILSDKCVKGRGNGSVLCWKPGKAAILPPILTPLINSKPSLNFTYGLLEVRAKMPSGDWIEPVLSLQPVTTSVYGEGIESGQIHLVDTRGNRELRQHDGLSVGSEHMCPDIRYGTSKTRRIVYDCLNTPAGEGFDRDFHLYQIEWSPDGLTLKVDGEGVASAPYPKRSMTSLWRKGNPNLREDPWKGKAVNEKMAPFDRPFYLVMGLHVGGNNGYFSDDFESVYPKPWKNVDGGEAPKHFWEGRHLWEESWREDGSALQIDYIRVYALNQTVSEGEGGGD